MINRNHIAQTGQIPDGLQLFQDDYPLEIVDTKKSITESASGTKIPVMKLTGVFQRADEKNANGRIYPANVLKQAIGDMQEAVKNRRVLGEYDHPETAKIHMERVSHLITKLFMEGKVVYGEIEVINDERCPFGSQLACLMDRKVQVGISSRGVGDMEMTECDGEDAYMVQPGFSFVTFDCVAEPSVKGTQLEKINESLIRNIYSKKRLKQIREQLLRSEISKLFR